MARLTPFTITVFLSLLISFSAQLARSQVPIDEAERRLRERMATKPAGTQPSSEIERLREENRRLRERVADLQQEIGTLKEILGRTKPAAQAGTRAATGPAVAARDGLNKELVGRWRGGDITAGSSYVLEFNADGAYKQRFVVSDRREAGQYRLSEDNIMEMWSDKAADDRKHNQYRVTATADQMTLTPILVDGVEVKTPRPLVLRRAE